MEKQDKIIKIIQYVIGFTLLGFVLFASINAAYPEFIQRIKEFFI